MLLKAGHVFHDDVAHGTEHLTLTGVLAKSSNLGAILTAEKVGPDGLGLFEAAAAGEVAVVRRRLTEGWEIEDRSDDGFTPLHFAAYFGRLEVARLLLELGADPNAVASNGSRVTPLHSAVSARHRDLAGLLLALGASANAVQKGGWTPLHAAAHDGD